MAMAMLRNFCDFIIFIDCSSYNSVDLMAEPYLADSV